MDQMKNRIRLLSNVTIFNKLTPEELAALAACCVEREYKKGALILSRNTEGDTLFIVMSGRVKAVLSARSGREIVLSFFKPGEFFGELSLVDKMPRSADVMTIEETKVLTLHRDDFRRLTQQNYELMLSIVAVLCARLRHADELIGNLALMDVYGRII
ncbi:MAG: cyclic nucleotide-binding domain-containing protein, partial [Myxococcota bacterium]